MIRHSPLRESAGVRDIPSFTPKPYRMTPKSTKDIMREQNFINDSVRGKQMDANYRPIKIIAQQQRKLARRENHSIQNMTGVKVPTLL